MKVDVIYSSDPKGNLYQISTYLRCAEEFDKNGIKMAFFCERIPEKTDANLTVLQVRDLKSGMLALNHIQTPVIIEERNDSAMIQFPELARIEKVVRINKVAVVRRDWINEPYLKAYSKVSEESPDFPSRLQLTTAERDKIRCGFHFGMFDYLQQFIQISFPVFPNWNYRPIDVVFIGSRGNEGQSKRRHRDVFFEAVKRLHGLNIVVSDHKLGFIEDYIRMLWFSKIVLSPWGNGELCYRDFEAWLAGCILIKPQTQFISTTGNMLNLGGNYHACDADYWDLDLCIHSALKNNTLFENRERNRLTVLDWWQPEKLVAWWMSEHMRYAN